MREKGLFILGVKYMSFISKVELRYQLEKMGIKVEGNYVRKKDLERVTADTFVNFKKLTKKEKKALDIFLASLRKVKNVAFELCSTHDDIIEIDGDNKIKTGLNAEDYAKVQYDVRNKRVENSYYLIDAYCDTSPNFSTDHEEIGFNLKLKTTNFDQIDPKKLIHDYYSIRKMFEKYAKQD